MRATGTSVLAELKAQRHEASNLARVVRDGSEHERLRRLVISLTRQIKAVLAAERNTCTS